MKDTEVGNEARFVISSMFHPWNTGKDQKRSGQAGIPVISTHVEGCIIHAVHEIQVTDSIIVVILQVEVVLRVWKLWLNQIRMSLSVVHNN